MKSTQVLSTSWLLSFVAALVLGPKSCSEAATEIRDICRVKGQEENLISGLGLVVGLNGTGESGDLQTMRALAQSFRVMGNPISGQPVPTIEELQQLSKVKNVALVIVTATIPATGARRGDKLDCFVSAANGKSLVGGRLVFASLLGPNTKDPRVYGLAEGPVIVENPNGPLTGRVHNGCQVVQDIFTPYHLDGQVTFVLDRHHADFVTATAIADRIRETPNVGIDMVQAINASNIVVRIPQAYVNDPVAFVAQILETELYAYEKEPEARITINEKTGAIVISGDVEIGAVVISHNNITVDTDPQQTGAPFLALDTEQTASPKLAHLVDTLNQLKVPTSDILEIIKGIERAGKLHGRLIIE